MATFNGSKYIREQLDSILCQLGEKDEVVISDDCSTDDTVEIIRSYNDPRIQIHTFKREKKGFLPVQLTTTNYENAIKLSKGDYIFLADQDDVWLPTKVKDTMHYLSDLGYDYTLSNYYITDSDLKVIGESSLLSFNKWKSLFGYAPFHGGTTAFRRSILKDVLPFPKNIQSHDRWIGWIATFKYKYLIFQPERLIYYRRHRANVSTSSGKSKNSIFYRIKTRLEYCYHLIGRLL